LADISISIDNHTIIYLTFWLNECIMILLKLGKDTKWV
jgi:hypothetical protein